MFSSLALLTPLSPLRLAIEKRARSVAMSGTTGQDPELFTVSYRILVQLQQELGATAKATTQ
jgi:hypothetical protein